MGTAASKWGLSRFPLARAQSSWREWCQMYEICLFTRFFQVTFFWGVLKWPFQGLSDLHLAYQKVTWKKLEYVYVFTHFHYLFVGDSAFWLAIFSKCLAIVLSWSENTDFSGPYCWDMFWCHWWDVNFPSQRPSLITFQLKTASRCFWVPKTVFSFGKQLRIKL